MKWVKDLFYEDDKLSLGRVSFFIVFGILIYFWIKISLVTTGVIVIPASLSDSFLYLLAYNLGKHFKKVMLGKDKSIEIKENNGN